MKFKTQTLMFALVAALSLTACGQSDQKSAAAAKQQMPNPTVDVQTIALQSVPIIQSFAGRVAALEVSDVRPQATGVIDQVLFQEGSYVQAGQPLYRINIDNYTSAVLVGQAAVDNALAAVHNAEAAKASAQANLVAKEAALAQAEADLARLDGLLEVEAISRQSYDQAVTAVKTARANVSAAKAAVAQASSAVRSAQSSVATAKANLGASELNLNRTIVKAPISGIAGISAVTSGALVAANQSTPLVTISRLDQVYVDISQSSAEMLRLREQLSSGKAGQGTPEVQLELEDGQIYPIIGRLASMDAKVNQQTGAMTLRAVFPNPNNLLVPGMYVNARLIQSVVHQAALLPQTAIMRTPKGEVQVYVVDNNNKIQVRHVTTAGTYHGQWIVTDGISDGDRVVIMGGTKVKPEQEVTVRELPPTGSSANGAPVQAEDTPVVVPRADKSTNQAH